MASTEAIVLQVLAGVIAGGVYGLLWFARRKYGKGQDPEKMEFNPYKLTGTLIVAAIIGGAAGAQGAVVTYENVVNQLVSYAGVIALIEPILKVVYERSFGG